MKTRTIARSAEIMAFHPRQNLMLQFTFYFLHFILHLLFDIRVYTFVIQLSSCSIQVFALYIHLFVRNIQVRVQVQWVALSSFRIQCWAFANQVFAFNIWLYVFHLQVCIVHSTFQTVLFIRWSSTKGNRWAQLTQPTPANITMERLLTGVGSGDLLRTAFVAMLIFEERGKPKDSEKNLSEQSKEPTTNLTHSWPGFGPRRWEASAITTTPSLHSLILPSMLLTSNRNGSS